MQTHTHTHTRTHTRTHTHTHAHTDAHRRTHTHTHARTHAAPEGRSKGCAIVEYASAQDANKAIAQLNNSQIMGRLIFVREDREGGR